MAGLNNILERIKGESEQVVSSIVNEAKDYAKSVEDDYRRKLASEIEKINKKCDQEIKSISDRSISSSELKKKQIFLTTKQELIMDTIDKAKEKLINLPDNEYIEYLKKVFDKNLPTSDCVIVFNEKDHKRIPKDIIDGFIKKAKEKGINIKLSDKIANIRSGFILDFGGVEGNCSFESLIEQNIESLIDKVNNILFS